MGYVDPDKVNSPKGSVRNLEVVFNSHASGMEADWAVAELEWDGKPVVGIRWNGDEGEPGIGNPQSRGHPTWFIVPPELAGVVLEKAKSLSKAGRNRIAEGYRAMARDPEREAEATEWTEGLIGDGGDPER